MGNTLHTVVATYIATKDGNYNGVAKYRNIMSILMKVENRYVEDAVLNSQTLYNWMLFSAIVKPQIISCNLAGFIADYCETNYTYQINHRGKLITIHTRNELNIPYFAAQYHFSGEMTLPDEYTIHDLYLLLICSGESTGRYLPLTLTEEKRAMLDFFGVSNN